ncbi:hypothetical protein E2C01_026906 [Portunus trituberculatus]|uniref:Uncharacterized protein n=1 Tax=Portunus trituberculatus TaxID=210409 RepID=A0A5B7EGR2_PORTR|nr:hypothetical protein [Portunus trituberculatus]
MWLLLFLLLPLTLMTLMMVVVVVVVVVVVRAGQWMRLDMSPRVMSETHASRNNLPHSHVIAK